APAGPRALRLPGPAQARGRHIDGAGPARGADRDRSGATAVARTGRPPLSGRAPRPRLRGTPVTHERWRLGGPGSAPTPRCRTRVRDRAGGAPVARAAA